MQCGNYKVTSEFKERAIFPVTQSGKRIRVVIINRIVHLQHAAGERVSFDRHLHLKRWVWGDSRMKGVVSDQHVRDEIGRMIGCPSTARQIVAAIAAGIPL